MLSERTSRSYTVNTVTGNWPVSSAAGGALMFRHPDCSLKHYNESPGM